MSIEHRPISPLRQRMIEDMCLRKLGEKTQTSYIRWVKQYSGPRVQDSFFLSLSCAGSVTCSALALPLLGRGSVPGGA